MTEPTGISAQPAGRSGPGHVSRAERELDDALYYLHEGCKPCVQRHLDLARRFGATEEQIAAVIQADSS
jgi:AhpD family alkylhydroperoxidase